MRDRLSARLDEVNSFRQELMKVGLPMFVQRTRETPIHYVKAVRQIVA